MDNQLNNIKYAGFWQRLGAYLFDGLILWLIGSLSPFFKRSRLFELYYVVPGLLLQLMMNVYLVKRFGGTPGKLVLKTKIQRIDGLPMDYQTAFARYSVVFVLSIFLNVANVMALLVTNDEVYNSLGFIQRAVELGKHNPAWAKYVNFAMQCWVWSEFIVMLTNKKRRALHDFMAGTVVVQSE